MPRREDEERRLPVWKCSIRMRGCAHRAVCLSLHGMPQAVGVSLRDFLPGGPKRFPAQERDAALLDQSRGQRKESRVCFLPRVRVADLAPVLGRRRDGYGEGRITGQAGGPLRGGTHMDVTRDARRAYSRRCQALRRRAGLKPSSRVSLAESGPGQPAAGFRPANDRRGRAPRRADTRPYGPCPRRC